MVKKTCRLSYREGLTFESYKVKLQISRVLFFSFLALRVLPTAIRPCYPEDALY